MSGSPPSLTWESPEKQISEWNGELIRPSLTFVNVMKVVFLIRALNFGGAERQLVALARGLQRRGHEVAVAVFYSGGALESELKEAGIPIRSLEKRGRWDVFGFAARLLMMMFGWRLRT